MIRWKYILVLACITLLSGGCGSASGSNTTDSSDATSSDNSSSSSITIDTSYESFEESDDYTYDESSARTITFANTSISSDSSAVTITETNATITEAGTYILSGTLDDGHLIVDTEDEDAVQLIFDGVDMTSTTNAPINIQSAAKTIIILKEGTTNYITDAASYVFADGEDEPNAALFSKDNLAISGTGSLVVTANYNDGITSKDALVINSGNISVTAVDDGIRGKDYLVIHDGTIDVTSAGDGFKSDEDEDLSLGYIVIEDGDITINATDGDAIQAESNVTITGGSFDITTAGGYTTSRTDEDSSAKGIKAETKITITGGTFDLNCADDAIHTNDTIVITDGSFDIDSGDDAIHSDLAMNISGGEITVNNSYEAIESGVITIDEGTIRVRSDDDGINAASDEVSNRYLTINGGYIVVDADGDGIDVNGVFEMTGGTVIVNGPTSSGDGSLDYDMTFKISGGTLIATGSSRMAQAPSSTSSQYAVLVNLTAAQSAGTLLDIQNSSGEDLITFAPSKSYQSIVYSLPSLASSNSYSLYLGGSASGSESDGLYDGGYSAGTLYTTFTINSTITTVGTSSSR